jgi:hypothetical protein
MELNNPFLDDFRALMGLEDNSRFYEWMETSWIDREHLTTRWRTGKTIGELLKDDVAFRQDMDRRIQESRKREEWTKYYAWAIPTEDAIRHLVELSPILEVGAGGGYWAWLIGQMGGRSACYDLGFRQVEKQWHPVEYGGAEIVRCFRKHTLFLCWPEYNTAFAFDCLRQYRGEFLVYVGEGCGGCTGDDNFHGLIEDEYDEVKDLNIPQYYGIRDFMTIYRRKLPRNRHWTFYRKRGHFQPEYKLRLTMDEIRRDMLAPQHECVAPLEVL